MAQTGDLTLNAGQTLGSLTPIIGQPLSQQTLAYAMLAHVRVRSRFVALLAHLF